MNKFEQYLMGIFMEDNPTLLDDDYPDAFDVWYSDLTEEELIEYEENMKRGD